MTTTGCVHLIGTGPGDPLLITVRGRQRLAAADVVVFAGRCVPDRLLRWARPDAERIDVDAAGSGASDADATHRLLADRAHKGLTVAHLTAGDPFASGAAADAARYLHDRGIRIEVVPGVLRLVAAPGFAGVAIAGEGAADAVLVVPRGPATSDGAPAVDWNRLAPSDATLVSEGRGSELARMGDELLRHGSSPAEPATLVLHGTLPAQHTIEGSLREVRDTARELAETATGVLVVGRNSRRRASLRWFDARPLFGKRILVTRPRAQAAAFVDRLADLGAEPIEAPMIRIAPPEDEGPLEAACAAAGSFDWIVFTSVNGVDAFMKRLLGGPRDIRALGSSRLCAIGPATAAGLRRYGLEVDLMPAEHRAEGVAAALRRNHDVAGARILLPRADIARAALPDELRRAGAEVSDVAAYRTVPMTDAEGIDVSRMLRERRIDVVTFTSASTVHNLVTRIGPGPAAELLADVVVASIGPVTADAARRAGIATAIVPSTYTVPALAEAIATHFDSRTP
ncbi:MAG: uroporphyrinogen-III synthase [Acidobacteria bacterium]|nr:uroporphyrinogen-III synthase [Acidobacteriota bacterium]